METGDSSLESILLLNELKPIGHVA
jgi:hypothetical protein